jgi:hypothetical protein
VGIDEAGHYYFALSIKDLCVLGDLDLFTNSELHVYASVTNATYSEYGALVDIGGDLVGGQHLPADGVVQIVVEVGDDVGDPHHLLAG